MDSRRKLPFICLILVLQTLYHINIVNAQLRKKVRLRKEDVINATEKQIGTVYFLHAAGDNGREMKLKLYDQFPNFTFPHLKIVFPTAPEDMYTGYDGRWTNIWYNRPQIALKVPEDSRSAHRTWRSFKRLVQHEVDLGIPLNKIIIGGFSMGGGFALHVAYRFLPEIAGCFAMSSFLVVNSSVYDEVKYGKRIPPLLMTHGEADSEIPFYWGHLTYQTLHDIGVKGVFYHEPTALHEMSYKQLEKVINWIYELIPDPNAVSKTTENNYFDIPEGPDSSDFKGGTVKTTKTSYATRPEKAIDSYNELSIEKEMRKRT